MLAKRQIPYIAPEAGTNKLNAVCAVCISKNCIFVDINNLEGKQTCVCFKFSFNLPKTLWVKIL